MSGVRPNPASDGYQSIPTIDPDLDSKNAAISVQADVKQPVADVRPSRIGYSMFVQQVFRAQSLSLDDTKKLSHVFKVLSDRVGARSADNHLDSIEEQLARIVLALDTHNQSLQRAVNTLKEEECAVSRCCMGTQQEQECCSNNRAIDIAQSCSYGLGFLPLCISGTTPACVATTFGLVALCCEVNNFRASFNIKHAVQADEHAAKVAAEQKVSENVREMTRLALSLPTAYSRYRFLPATAANSAVVATAATAINPALSTSYGSFEPAKPPSVTGMDRKA